MTEEHSRDAGMTEAVTDLDYFRRELNVGRTSHVLTNQTQRRRLSPYSDSLGSFIMNQLNLRPLESLRLDVNLTSRRFKSLILQPSALPVFSVLVGAGD